MSGKSKADKSEPKKIFKRLRPKMTTSTLGLSDVPQVVSLAPALSSEDKLLHLTPLALQISADGTRPLILLKDESGKHIMPVILSPLEAGVALTQANRQGLPLSPHKVTVALLKSLESRLERGVFVAVENGYQWLQLELTTPLGPKQLRLRAEEALNLCLHLQTPLFATLKIIQQSKEWAVQRDAEMKQLLSRTDLLKNPHAYVM